MDEEVDYLNTNPDDITKSSGHSGLAGFRGTDLYAPKKPTKPVDMSEYFKESQTGNKDLDDAINYYNQSMQQRFRVESGEAINDFVNLDRAPTEGWFSPELETYGDSKYDEATTGLLSQDKIDDMRANNQQWYERIGAGVGTMVLTVPTDMASTVGALWAVGAGLVNAATDDVPEELEPYRKSVFEYVMEEINNNTLVTLANKWRESVNAGMPIYQTAEQKREGLASMSYLMSSAAIGDFIGNMAFTIASMYTGIGIAGGLAKLSSLPGRLGKIARNPFFQKFVASLGAAIGEGAFEANTNSNEWVREQTDFLRNSKNEQLAKAKLEYGEFMLHANNDDERAELGKNFEDKKNEIEDNYIKAVNDAERLKLNVAKRNFAHNIGILTISNMFMFGTLFAKAGNSLRAAAKPELSKLGLEELYKRLELQGINTAQMRTFHNLGIGSNLFSGASKKNYATIARTIEQIKGEGMPGMFNTSAKYTFADGLFDTAKRMLSEGTEEFSQSMSSDFSKAIAGYRNEKYYAHLSDTEAQFELQQMLNEAETRNSTILGLMAPLFTWDPSDILTLKNASAEEIAAFNAIRKSGRLGSNAWGEFISGALMGITGVPGLSRLRSKKTKVDEHGNIVLDRDEAGNVQYQWHIPIAWKNSIFQEISSKKQDIAHQNQLAESMNKFIKEGNTRQLVEQLMKFAHYNKNLRFHVEQDDVKEIKDARLDMLITAIETFANAGRIEDLTNMLEGLADGITAEEAEQFKEMTKIKDETGKETSAFEGITGDELLKKVKEHFKESVSTVKEWAKTRGDLDAESRGRLSDEALAHMTWYRMHVMDWQDRMRKLLSNELASEEILDKLVRFHNLSQDEIDRILTSGGSTSLSEDDREKYENMKSYHQEALDLINKLRNGTDKDKLANELLNDLLVYHKPLQKGGLYDNIWEYLKSVWHDLGNYTGDAIHDFFAWFRGASFTNDRRLARQNHALSFWSMFMKELDMINSSVNEGANVCDISKDEIEGIQRAFNDLFRCKKGIMDYTSYYNRMRTDPESLSFIKVEQMANAAKQQILEKKNGIKQMLSTMKDTKSIYEYIKKLISEDVSNILAINLAIQELGKEGNATILEFSKSQEYAKAMSSIIDEKIELDDADAGKLIRFLLKSLIVDAAANTSNIENIDKSVINRLKSFADDPVKFFGYLSNNITYEKDGKQVNLPVAEICKRITGFDLYETKVQSTNNNTQQTNLERLKKYTNSIKELIKNDFHGPVTVHGKVYTDWETLYNELFKPSFDENTSSEENATNFINGALTTLRNLLPTSLETQTGINKDKFKQIIDELFDSLNNQSQPSQQPSSDKVSNEAKQYVSTITSVAQKLYLEAKSLYANSQEIKKKFNLDLGKFKDKVKESAKDIDTVGIDNTLAIIPYGFKKNEGKSSSSGEGAAEEDDDELKVIEATISQFKEDQKRKKSLIPTYQKSSTKYSVWFAAVPFFLKEKAGFNRTMDDPKWKSITDYLEHYGAMTFLDRYSNLAEVGTKVYFGVPENATKDINGRVPILMYIKVGAKYQCVGSLHTASDAMLRFDGLSDFYEAFDKSRKIEKKDNHTDEKIFLMSDEEGTNPIFSTVNQKGAGVVEMNDDSVGQIDFKVANNGNDIHLIDSDGHLAVAVPNAIGGSVLVPLSVKKLNDEGVNHDSRLLKLIYQKMEEMIDALYSSDDINMKENADKAFAAYNTIANYLKIQRSGLHIHIEKYKDQFQLSFKREKDASGNAISPEFVNFVKTGDKDADLKKLKEYFVNLNPQFRIKTSLLNEMSDYCKDANILKTNMAPGAAVHTVGSYITVNPVDLKAKPEQKPEQAPTSNGTYTEIKSPFTNEVIFFKDEKGNYSYENSEGKHVEISDPSGITKCKVLEAIMVNGATKKDEAAKTCYGYLNKQWYKVTYKDGRHYVDESEDPTAAPKPKSTDETILSELTEHLKQNGINITIQIDMEKVKPGYLLIAYTHMWDNIVRAKNPALWKRGVELMKETTVWKKFLEHEDFGKKWIAEGKTGEELDNLIASEVHARLAGDSGIIENARQKEGKSFVDKLTTWLKEFWFEVGKTLGVWSEEELNKLTIEDFRNMTIRDFLTNPKLDGEEKPSSPSSKKTIKVKLKDEGIMIEDSSKKAIHIIELDDDEHGTMYVDPNASWVLSHGDVYFTGAYNSNNLNGTSIETRKRARVVKDGEYWKVIEKGDVNGSNKDSNDKTLIAPAEQQPSSPSADTTTQQGQASQQDEDDDDFGSGRRGRRSKLSRATPERMNGRKKINIDKELEALRRVLPGLTREEAVLIVDTLMTVGRYGLKAQGLFRDGLIVVSRGAVAGTMFHEAFHKLFQTCLSEDEKQKILEEVFDKRNTTNAAVAEEILADAFADYMVDRTYNNGFSGRIIRFFKRLWDMIFNSRSSLRYADKLFRKINNGEFADKEVDFMFSSLEDTRIDIMMETGMSEEMALWSESQRNSFDNLEEDDQLALISKGVSQEEYDSLSFDLRDELLLCL